MDIASPSLSLPLTLVASSKWGVAGTAGPENFIICVAAEGSSIVSSASSRFSSLRKPEAGFDVKDAWVSWCSQCQDGGELVCTDGLMSCHNDWLLSVPDRFLQ